MTTRRMRIDDYELMAHARRAYLAYLDARELAGEELPEEETRIRDLLRGDTRLEGALTMDWEVVPEFDRALVVALRYLDEHVREELAAQRIPAAHLDGYVARRKEAIARTIARLTGEAPDPDPR